MMMAFAAVVVALLMLDLFVIGARRNGRHGYVAALVSSAIWVSCATAFGLSLFWWQGAETGLQFLTGYMIELSLSIDNLFVFLLLFSQFAVPPHLQHRILFWGVLGAIVMRVAMIAAGTVLIADFHWLLYGFGIFLMVAGWRMLTSPSADAASTGPSKLLGWLTRRLPVAATPYDGRFIIRQAGKWSVTPLFVVLVAVEATDLVFAVDSVPAVFAVTTDPFVVASSNIFAILELRSLYFALSGLIERLKYLKYGLAAVLMFVGAKLVFAGVVPIPVVTSLLITLSILGSAVAASLLKTAGREAIPARDYDKAFLKLTKYEE
jgi:tellurite resistance protein TerC